MGYIQEIIRTRNQEKYGIECISAGISFGLKQLALNLFQKGNCIYVSENGRDC